MPKNNGKARKEWRRSRAALPFLDPTERLIMGAPEVADDNKPDTDRQNGN